MSDVPDILKKILARKAEEIVERGARIGLRDLRRQIDDAAPTRPFLEQLRRAIGRGDAAVLAEIKRASPSKGLLRDPFHPADIARGYAAFGATCLSVLTDRDFFRGCEDDLRDAHAACALPVLRKDFIVDPYQVYEARAIGADCVLLIVAALDEASLRDLTRLALELGMDVLVEVHDAGELDRALALDAPLIGINNRDLRTFATRLDTTLDLLPRIPADRTVVTESGVHTPADVALLRERGVCAFLVGEAFMVAEDPGAKLAKLFETRIEGDRNPPREPR